MSGPILSVKFFRTESGNEPVRDFLRDLPPEDRKIIGTDIKEVQFGWPLGMPLVRKMEKDLCALFTVIDGQMVRLHPFIKKWQGTPQPDLEIAGARKNQL